MSDIDYSTDVGDWNILGEDKPPDTDKHNVVVGCWYEVSCDSFTTGEVYATEDGTFVEIMTGKTKNVIAWRLQVAPPHDWKQKEEN